MPQDKYNPTDFAAAIREKYPKQYDNYTDQDLTSAVLEAHPEYSSQVDFTAPQPQQPAIGSQTQNIKPQLTPTQRVDANLAQPDPRSMLQKILTGPKGVSTPTPFSPPADAPLGLKVASGVLGAAGTVPSAANAKADFNAVKSLAENLPGVSVDITEPAKVAKQAQVLAGGKGVAPIVGGRGSTLPKVMKDFIARATMKDAPNMTWQEAQDFKTAAGRLSISERWNTNPPMKALIGKLAGALDGAMRETADSMGQLDTYGHAVREYANSQKLKIAAGILGAAGLSSVAAAAKIGGATAVAKKVWDVI